MNESLPESKYHFSLEASEYKGEGLFRLDMTMEKVCETFGSFDEKTLTDFLQAESDQDYIALARRFPVMFFFHGESCNVTSFEDIKDICKVLRFVFASKSIIDSYEKGEEVVYPDFLLSLGFKYEEHSTVDGDPVYRICINLNSRGYKDFLGPGYIVDDSVGFVIFAENSLEGAMSALKVQIAHLVERHLHDFRLGVNSNDLSFFVNIRHVISGLYYYAVQEWSNKRIGLCSVCGKPYLAPASRKNPRRYCSNKCRKAAYNKSHSKEISDSNNE